MDASREECGLVQLAERTVGAPFVGAMVSALVVAELVRMALRMHRYELIDGTLRSPECLTAVEAEPRPPFNPGTAAVHAPATTTAVR
jgi:hypothetical protein